MSEREPSMSDIRARQWGGSVWPIVPAVLFGDTMAGIPLWADDRYQRAFFFGGIVGPWFEASTWLVVRILTGQPDSGTLTRFTGTPGWERQAPRDYTLPMRPEDIDGCSRFAPCDGSCRVVSSVPEGGYVVDSPAEPGYYGRLVSVFGTSPDARDAAWDRYEKIVALVA